jgi:hypothetical protein
LILFFLSGPNFLVWEPYLETLLKSKQLWQYMKIPIRDPTDDHTKFIVDGKNDEVVGVIMIFDEEYEFIIQLI